MAVSTLPVEALPKSADWYRSIFQLVELGMCVVQVQFDGANRAVDYRFVEANPQYERQTGHFALTGRTAREVTPDLEDFWFEIYGRVALTGEPARFRAPAQAGGRVFDVMASRIGLPHERLVAIAFTDVTARSRAEAELREGRDRFREFADFAPAMLWVTEANGECSYLSRRWYEGTGQDESSGLGMGWLDAVHPDDRASAQDAFLDANARQAPFELEHRLRMADGTYRWVIDAGQPRFDGAGRFAGYVGSVIDIDHRRQAEESLRRSRERLDLVVEGAKLGLWYCDLPFTTLDWTPRVKEHFGLPPEAEVTIETFWERLHPDDREKTRIAMEAAITQGRPYDVDYRTVAPDGSVRWIRAIGRAHRDRAGVPTHFDGITVDVTQRVEATEALKAADRRKDEFLAILAHELRNPLAPIVNGLRLLEAAADNPRIAGRAREVMHRQVRHLVRLVDDLLDVSRISRGKLELRRKRVALADVVEQAVDLSRPFLEASGNQFTATPAPQGVELEVDDTRIAQALSNLLNNAAKFTGPGGHIALEVEADGGQVRLRVRDDGIGIPPETLPNIFGMFSQAPHAKERSHGGLGIGLALAHSLVALHGGRLDAASPGAGHGATFTITLPRAQ